MSEMRPSWRPFAGAMAASAPSVCEPTWVHSTIATFSNDDDRHRHFGQCLRFLATMVPPLDRVRRRQACSRLPFEVDGSGCKQIDADRSALIGKGYPARTVPNPRSPAGLDQNHLRA